MTFPSGSASLKISPSSFNSALVEQLRTETVKSYMAVLQSADSVAVQNFEYHRSELSKYHTEAKDNVRFLSTLERHFKVL